MGKLRAKSKPNHALFGSRRDVQAMPDRAPTQFTNPFPAGQRDRPVLAVIPPNRKAGTAFATRVTGARVSMSCSVSPTPKARHTGAGTRATAVSHALTRHQCRQILWASARATLAGQPFNRHTTFHHEAMGIPNERGHDAVAALIKLASDYLATKGFRLHWAVTRENGLRKGAHAHILWHIPYEVAKPFHGRWRSWKARLARSYAKPELGRGGQVLMTRRIGGTARAYLSNPQALAFHLDQVLGYVMKGADPETISALGMAKGHQPGGMIIGRRAGWWRLRQRKELPQ
jgi:hypothetical protein